MNRFLSPGKKRQCWAYSLVTFVLTCFTSSSVFAAVPISSLGSLKDPSVSEPLPHFEIPESVGKIKVRHQGTRPGLYVHIQDAHINEEAQKNIGKILKYLNEKHGMHLIGIEGAEGRLYPEFLSFFPDKKIRTQVADFLMREGRLSGPEYYSVVERPPVRLFGVEDQTLYKKNKQAYLAAIEGQEKMDAALSVFQKTLKDLSLFVLSEPLRKMNELKSGWDNGEGALIPYVRYLAELAEKNRVDLEGFQQTKVLTRIFELENKTDFVKLEEEIKALPGRLKEEIPANRRSRFLAATVQFQRGRMDKIRYYRYLASELLALQKRGEAGKEKPWADPYKQLLTYLEYVELYEQIGADLFTELELLASRIKEKVFQNPEEKACDRMFEIFRISERLFRLELNQQDAEFFYENAGEFSSKHIQKTLAPMMKAHHFSQDLKPLDVLDARLERVRTFYDLALERDPVLIERAIQETQRSGEKVSALITGGFHTPGIERVLKEKGYSYVVITPAISRVIDSGKEKDLYMDALREKPVGLQKILLEGYLAPRSVRVNDPRFQLSVGSVLPTESSLENFGVLLRNNLQEGKSRFAATVVGMYLSSVLKLMGVPQPDAFLSDLKQAASQEDPEVRERLLVWLDSIQFAVSPETKRVYLALTQSDGSKRFFVFAWTSLHATASEIKGLAGISRTDESMLIEFPEGRLWGAPVSPEKIPSEILASLGFEGARMEVTSELVTVSESEKPRRELRKTVSKPVHFTELRQHRLEEPEAEEPAVEKLSPVEISQPVSPPQTRPDEKSVSAAGERAVTPVSKVESWRDYYRNKWQPRTVTLSQQMELRVRENLQAFVTASKKQFAIFKVRIVEDMHLLGLFFDSLLVKQPRSSNIEKPKDISQATRSVAEMKKPWGWGDAFGVAVQVGEGRSMDARIRDSVFQAVQAMESLEVKSGNLPGVLIYQWRPDQDRESQKVFLKNMVQRLAYQPESQIIISVFPSERDEMIYTVNGWAEDFGLPYEALSVRTESIFEIYQDLQKDFQDAEKFQVTGVDQILSSRETLKLRKGIAQGIMGLVPERILILGEDLTGFSGRKINLRSFNIANLFLAWTASRAAEVSA